jgi:lipopolysaccharide transport system permease protein
MAAVIPPLADFFIASVLMIGLMVAYHIPVTANIVFAPVFVLLASTLALGVGFWAAALHVKYRDVFHIIPFFLQLGMFASPIFYSTTAIPKAIQSMYFLNPMFGIIDGFRWSLVGTAPPSITSIEVSVAVSLVFLISGITYFRLREDEFADYE